MVICNGKLKDIQGINNFIIRVNDIKDVINTVS